MSYTHCLGVPLSVDMGNDVNVDRNIFIDHIVRCFSREILSYTSLGSWQRTDKLVKITDSIPNSMLKTQVY